MKTLASFVAGRWHEADGGFASLVDPSTEEVVARVSSAGVDFGDVLDHARTVGGPALRSMTFAERGAMLKAMSAAIREHRDELLELSALNNGATPGDGSFDVDGASGTLYYYSGVGRSLGERRTIPAGDGTQLAKTEAFYARHLWVPRDGVAVAINAFNFPAWGFAEKAACALLAGMPMIVKPATATALVAHRTVEVVLASGAVPEGALQLVCGRTGDLLDRLGGQDVLAFTGSADTAAKLRNRDNLRATNTRINVEADSLNAAVLAPDARPEGDAWNLFVRDIGREVTQKAGQKCTAVRRIFVPRDRLDAAQQALTARLDRVVTGDPRAEGTKMGPLATESQLDDTVAGIARLAETARIVHGTGERIDGNGVPAGKGYFVGPTLLRAGDARNAGAVHEHEVFGPVATLLPYDGDAAEAAGLVALGGGTLVTSVYGDDAGWVEDFVGRVGAHTGRVYWGSTASSSAAMGSGAALPQCLHGGPGRAGGGEELGGMAGVERYLQRVALQGAKDEVDGVVEG